MILFIFLMALSISWISLPQVIKWAKSAQQFDPNDERKTHTGQISALGGLGVLLALLCTCLLPAFQASHLWHLLPALVFLFAISVWDDLKGLPALFRLFIQLMLASWLYMQGWMLAIPMSYPITLVFILLFINAYNFIDGINGLSGILGVLAMACFSVLFLLEGMQIWACFCVAYTGALSGFLRFNFGKRAQIFLGDNGSTVLGLSIAICLIQLTNQCGLWSNSNLIALTVVALPIFDLVRIVLIRILRGSSPFKADRQHFHHLLVDAGWSAPQVCLLVASTIIGTLLIMPLLGSLPAKLVLLSCGMAQLYLMAWWQNLSIRVDSIPAVKDQKIVSPAE